ncbi:hypothetical protein N7540_013125 [Penicillium herquei]|nr:hypothetical protein N7540_013125 [Penicillium herquei]
MVDPLSIAGIAYPIAKDLLRLARSMKRAYQGIRYANQDLFKAIKRTETVAQTFNFFSESLDKAETIEELGLMFEQHRKLIESVNGEAKRTIKELEYITTICRSMMDCPHVSAIQRWIAHFEWYRASKSIVPPLFQDMKILERSMRTIGILKLLRMEFRKLQATQKAQQEFYMQRKLSQNEERKQPLSFALEVLKILEEEIPRTFRENRFDDPPTNRSQPTSISLVSNSPQPAIHTPYPSQVKRRDRGFIFNMNDDGALLAGQSTSCSIPDPERTPPLPSVIHSSVSPDRSQPEQKNIEVSHEGLDTPEQQESGTAYMRLPPFGSPKLGPRPSAGRRSLDHPNNTSDDSKADNS